MIPDGSTRQKKDLSRGSQVSHSIGRSTWSEIHFGRPSASLTIIGQNKLSRFSFPPSISCSLPLSSSFSLRDDSKSRNATPCNYQFKFFSLLSRDLRIAFECMHRYRSFELYILLNRFASAARRQNSWRNRSWRRWNERSFCRLQLPFMEERVWFVEHISEVVSVRMSFVGWRMKMLLMSGSRINRLIFAVRKKERFLTYI